MSTTTPNIGLFKYDTIADSDMAFNINTALNNNWDLIDEAIQCGGGSVTRNIGEIVSSTIPLTDAGLHLLDGALIQGDGIYSAFVDYIAGLYNIDTTAAFFAQPTEGKTAEQNWQGTVATYGVCGKFVYDSTNNTVRLPKVTGIIEGTTDVNALGDLIQAGLPNITGKFGAMIPNYHSEKCSGVFFGTTIDNNSTFSWAGGSTNGSCYGYELNAYRSSSIYGNSSTVQPQTIKAFYYIVIATSTKTDIQVDLDNVVTDLNGKVNKSGDTMSGSLRVNSVIQATGGFDLISNAVTKGTNPSSIAYWGIRFNDGSNSSDWKATRLGVIEGSLDTSGTTQLLIGAYKNEANATSTSSLVLQCKSDGTTYFNFPKCTTKATTTSSASNSKVAVVVQNYVNGTSWYRVWSDGWIEQGGNISDSTITFLKPFSNTNYTITTNNRNNSTSGNTATYNDLSIYSNASYNKTTTSVFIRGAGTWYACGY